MKEIIEFLEKNKLGSIATCNKNKPDVRPFEVASISGQKLFFYASKDSDISKQLHLNPYICFCATNENYDYVKVSGHISFSNKQRDKEKVLENSSFAKDVYDNIGTDKMEVFYLEHGNGIKHTYVDGEVHIVEF